MKKIVFCVLCMTLLLGMTQICFATEDANETIKEGIRIDGIDVGGMTYDEAMETITPVAVEKLKTKATLKVGSKEIKVSLKKLGYQWKEDVVEDALGAGKKGNVIRRFKDDKEIKEQGMPLIITVEAEDEVVERKLEKKCDEYNLTAKNASLKFNGSGFDIIPEEEGCEVDYVETVKSLQEQIMNQWDGSNKLLVDATVSTSTPKYTTKDCEKVSDTAMGSFTTTFTMGDAYAGRNANLKHGVEMIDGTVLYPGEEYSCNAVLAPWTEENGWSPAGTYSEGEVVDSYGGGICQVSSTLYNALLNAEIQVTERYSHSMAVSYVDLAADAALAGDYKDLKFINNTDAPIYIRGIYDYGEISFKIYGHDTRPENRSVSYESVVTKTVPITDSVTKDSSQPKGYHSVESNGHVGYVAELYKIVYENGEEVSREKLHTSTYAMSPRKIVEGTGEDKKEEKTTKEEAETKSEKKESSQKETEKEAKKKEPADEAGDE
jgi:vancomycin resistance protein YoaR